MRRLNAVLVTMLLAFLVAPATGQKPSPNGPGRQAGSVEKFVANLPSGYTVFEGSAFNIDTAKLCCEGYLPTALFFNRSAPYVAFSVKNVSSPVPEFSELPLFQLLPGEAIVVIGVTPPAAKYFAYTPYLMTRRYLPETTPTAVFASLGDSVNVSNIRTLGADPFSRPMALILTPDRATEARVRAALLTAGYADAMINTLPLPASALQLGVDHSSQLLTSDTFLLLNRMSMFDSEVAGKAYLDALQDPDVGKRPLRVFRVTPPAAETARDPFAAPPLRVRGTGRRELQLASDLERLRQAIIRTYQDEYTYIEYHSRFAGYNGYEFIQRRKNTLGDNRDSLYLAAGYMPMWDLGNPEDQLTLAEDDILLVYGPNHVVTGKATYTNINVYASETVMFSMASVYSDHLGGSAEEYLGLDDPAAGRLYVHTFAYPGHCSGSQCSPLEVPSGCTPWCQTSPACPPFVLDSSTKLGLFFRNYLDPATGVGPAADELLYDQVIKLSPKK